MKVTLNWLKDYVDCDLSPEDLSHRLTMAGLEVDLMEQLGAGLDTVIVARLDEVQPHPDADRLTVCTVNNGTEQVQVVCGASNHRKGDLVAFAQVGTMLPGDFKIKKSKIRGQISMGMLCSLSELGLAEEAEGIMILPEGLELGQPAFEALGLKDVLYEIGLTPNRPDCLSVVGVAREVSAMTGQPLRLPEPVVSESSTQAAERSSVTIDDPDLCPRYAARLIEGVRVGPSPDWLVRKVEAVGMRSINNVVDVTNFVMMELGHPLHAFDFNLLRGRRIVVRRAEDGSTFTTLDDQQRQLTSNDLVICDGEGPVALAGIMGGQNSEVRPETTDILLESAYFDPIAIRRTSKRLGMHTESSHRFERGADVDMVPLALDRAAALIAELAGGSVAQGALDMYPAPLLQRNLTISAERTTDILGIEVGCPEIQATLESIGFECTAPVAGSGQVVEVKVPNFRPDVEREIDLIEEVARLIGYERIPVTMPTSDLACQLLPPHLQHVRRLRDFMVGSGFSEIINYSFVSPSTHDRLQLDAADPRRHTVKVLNPLTEDQSVMRTTLLPDLLETASRNLAYRNDNLSLFELRPVYSPVEGSDQPIESMRLSALICGMREAEGWAHQSLPCDFYDLKGRVEELLAALTIKDVRWESDHGEVFYHPGKSCAITVGGRVVGTLGEIHPAVQKSFDLTQTAYVFDLDVETLFDLAGSFPGFVPVSKFPDVERDSAFLVDDTVTAQQVFDALKQVKLKDLEDLVLFDVYSGEGVPEGKKSLAIRARYRALDRTLTDELIQNLHSKLVKVLKNNLGAEIR